MQGGCTTWVDDIIDAGGVDVPDDMRPSCCQKYATTYYDPLYYLITYQFNLITNYLLRWPLSHGE